MTSSRPVPETREEQAEREVGRTAIAPATARWMIAIFLLVIGAVPLAEIATQVAAGKPVAVLGLVRAPPGLRDFTFPIHRGHQAERNPLQSFEKSVEAASAPRLQAQVLVQGLLTAAGTGTSTVVRAGDGWLFYRPGIDYVAGPDFTGSAWAHIRPRFHPDAFAAIHDLDAACRAVGATLVLLPLPDKAQVHPEPLGRGRLDWPENPGLDRFLQRLGAAGIAALDLRGEFRAAAAEGAVFLRQDTHWTPAMMERVAALVADRVRPLLAAGPATAWTAETATATRVGDLVDALRLASGQRRFAPEDVVIHRVRAADGSLWTSAAEAPLVLLGDSYSNIYSAKAMGWGEAAGLAPQLALRLGRQVGAVTINGGGATAVRRDFASQGGPRRGQVVLWQFAVRDLAVEEWEPVTWKRNEPAPLAAGAEPMDIELVETSRLVGDHAQYPDAWVDHLGRLRHPAAGLPAGAWVVVVAPAKRDNRPQPALDWKVGSVVTGTARPWSTMRGDARTWRRISQAFSAVDTDEITVPAFVIEDGRIAPSGR